MTAGGMARPDKTPYESMNERAPGPLVTAG